MSVRRNVAGLSVTRYISENVRERPDGSRDIVWGEAEAVIKAPDLDYPNVAINEFICNRLAIACGIPTPMGDLWMDPSVETAALAFKWVSAEIRSKGHQLPPSYIDSLLEVPSSVMARILAFDVMVNNIDRHENNFLVSSRNEVWSIDHEMCLFQDVAPAARAEFLKSKTDSVYHDAIGFWKTIQLEHDDVDNAVKAISFRLSRDSIQQSAEHVCALGLISASEKKALIEYLTTRRSKLGQLINWSELSVRTMKLGNDDLFSEGSEDDNPSISGEVSRGPQTSGT
jgi:hypothetical protein